MKDSINIQGRDYDSRKLIQEKFDVDYTTIDNWAKNGTLPAPLRIGRRVYFDRLAVETQILAASRG
jgi:predicted DNA-binding transcriptional regulator AlpA